jgi:predicted acyltransferase
VHTPVLEHSVSPPSSGGSPQRLVSLDLFRGLTIAGMILVNNPGSSRAVYAPLLHADWNGWTVADLIFPCFLFMVGTSLLISCQRRRQQGATDGNLLLHVLWRSLALIAIGLVLNGLFFLPWHEVRVPGVLQRIGVVYFFATMITLTVRRRGRIFLTVLLLAGYWGLMMLVPSPSHAPGDVSQEGNLASFVDRQLMTGHLWRRDWDPEGLLSTIPAIATALCGTFAAEWILSASSRSRIAAGMLGGGCLALAIGYAWGFAFPINKNLWTSSFAVLTAGFAALALGVCYWIVDVRGLRRWAQPAVFIGMNPLAIYVASEIVGELLRICKLPNGVVAQQWMFRLLANVSTEEMASLMWAITYVWIWVAVAWLMHRKGVFIKL